MGTNGFHTSLKSPPLLPPPILSLWGHRSVLSGLHQLSSCAAMGKAKQASPAPSMNRIYPQILCNTEVFRDSVGLACPGCLRGPQKPPPWGHQDSFRQLIMERMHPLGPESRWKGGVLVLFQVILIPLGAASWDQPVEFSSLEGGKLTLLLLKLSQSKLSMLCWFLPSLRSLGVAFCLSWEQRLG